MPLESAPAWEQFQKAAEDARLSVSSLLLILIRAYLEGKISVTVATAEVVVSDAQA